MKKLIVSMLVLSAFALANTGEELVQNNGCMSCHNVMGKKLAPAFMGIAKRNMRFDASNAKINIINSIKNGSNGKYRNFSNTSMPSYTNFTNEELNNIATYILSLSKQNGMKGQGMRGKGMHGQGMRGAM